MKKLSAYQVKVYEQIKNAKEAIIEDGKIANCYHETYKNLDGTVHLQGINNKTLLALERAGLIQIIESQRTSLDMETVKLI